MLLLLMILAAGVQHSTHARHPVRWTAALGPPSRQALEARLERPVKTPRGQKIFTHTDPSREIRTCADYLRARRDGWSETANNYERATESFFKDQCDVLQLVLAAKPSRVSYVDRFRLDARAPDVLPPSISWCVSKDEVEEAEEAERRGLSWKQYQPGLKVLAASRNSLRVDEQGAVIALETKAFGDFDGDGVEDVLLFKAEVAVEEGTMRYYTPILLTRTAAGGPLRARELSREDVERAAPKAYRRRFRGTATVKRPSSRREQTHGHPNAQFSVEGAREVKI